MGPAWSPICISAALAVCFTGHCPQPPGNCEETPGAWWTCGPGQGPEGEGGLQGEPAEGSAGQPAALPQETATAEASVKKPEAEQGTPGSQDPGEAKEQKKVAEGQAPSKKGSPAFMHSPSCPAAISR